MSDQTEREAELIAERDRAREECGYEKTMRKALHDELGMWILLRREDRDRAEAAEARVRKLEGAAQQLRDDCATASRALFEFASKHGASLHEAARLGKEGRDPDFEADWLALVTMLRTALRGES